MSKSVSLTLKWSRSKMWRSDKALKRAVVGSMRKAGADALRVMRAESKRQIRLVRAIRAGYLTASAFPLTFAKGNDLSSLVWRMGVSSSGVPLSQYPVRQTKRGVSVEVTRGSRKIIEGSFLAVASSSEAGRKGVFLRPTSARYPMGHRLGPSVADNMKAKPVIPAVYRVVQRTFSRTFLRLLPIELAKVRGKK
jgi:hypothetical protein